METVVSETATRTSVSASCVAPDPSRMSTVPEPAATRSEKEIVNEPLPSVSTIFKIDGLLKVTATEPATLVSDEAFTTAEPAMNSVGVVMPRISVSC